MRNVSNTTRPDGYGQTSGEIGYFTEASPGEVYKQNLILRANPVPLSEVFSQYGLKISHIKGLNTCPFPSHKGGRERTPSFYYYPETDSFYCHGCRRGGEFAHGCHFMALMEGISYEKAAQKIIDIFKVSDDISVSDLESQDNRFDQLDIMLEFSNAVREFRQEHFDKKSQDFIEHMCMLYDQLNLKHKPDNKALVKVTQEIVDNIKKYKT